MEIFSFLLLLFRKFNAIIFIFLFNGSFLIVTKTKYVDSNHRLVKRMNLETCLGQFDIHRDTIIRTEESQSIGGKFIQGISLETTEECERLCCETEFCDVYIYEEKGDGYCYLFECGSPENFHCKFTRHSNYTSAVIAPIQRLKPVSTTKLPKKPNILVSNLSRHELELANLKQKSTIDKTQMIIKTSTISPPIQYEIPKLESPYNNKVNKTKLTTCGRFQFQCHSGECIAVYNACDSIPQCEDGSDEGPECPPTIPPIQKSIVNNNIQQSGLIGQQGIKYVPGESMVQVIKPPALQGSQRQYQSVVMNNREDQIRASQNWQDPKQVVLQSDLDRNSHIFSHKTGLHIPVNNIPQISNQAVNVYSPITRDMYIQQDVPGAYRNPLIQPQAPANINWQQQPLPQQQIYLTPEINYPRQLNRSPITDVKYVPVIQPNKSIISETEKPQLKLNEKLEINSNLETQKDKTTKSKTKIEESNEEDYIEASTEIPKKTLKKHRKQKPNDTNMKKKDNEPVIPSPLHQQYKIIKDNLEIEFLEHDGFSERPGGAVLSLTLGVIITAAFAILIGCKMRTVVRKARRIGKTPYAHDADFLVNGMYL